MAGKKGAGSAGDSVGSASVEIRAELVIENEEEVAQIAANAAAQGAGKGGGAAAKQPRDTAPKSVNVDAKVNTKLSRDVSKDVQDALDRGEFQITLDTDNIRQQINVALQRPFEIKLNAQVEGVPATANVGAAPSQGVMTGTPMTRPALPPEITELMRRMGKQGMEQSPFVGGINAVYRNINEMLQGAGKARFGSQSLEPGNEVEKALEMVEQFGDQLGWFTTSGPLGKLTGGSVVDFLKSQGVTEVKGSALEGNVGAFGGESKRSSDLFFTRLQNWARENPQQAQPAAANEQVANLTAQAVSREIQRNPNPAAEERASAAGQQGAEIERALQAERQAGIRATPLDLGRLPASPPPLRARTRRDEDPEAEARARQQLGDRNRANVRRLRGRGAIGAPGGINVDLEPFLRMAEMGGFENIWEQFTGKGFKESQGLFNLEPSGPESLAELGRLSKLKPGPKRQIGGQEGKFQRVMPTEAFTRAVIQGSGVGDDSATQDQIREFIDSQIEDVRKALGAGRSPLQGVRETRRGQGGTSTVATNDLGRRLVKFDEWIDYIGDRITSTQDFLGRVNVAIERASKNRDTGKVRELEEVARVAAGNLQRYEAGLTEAVETRKEIAVAFGEGITPEQARTNVAAQAIRGAENQERVRTGKDARGKLIGYSEAEFAARNYSQPAKIGGRMKDVLMSMGFPEEPEGTIGTPILNALRERFLEDPNRVTPTGDLRTGTQQMRQIAFGTSKRQEGGLLGELMGMLPADIGRTQKGEIRQTLRDFLQGAVSNEGFGRELLEEDVRRRESMPRLRQVSTSDIQHGLTGEGQFRFAPGQQAALEADIRLQEQKIAGLETKIAAGTPRKPRGAETDAARATRLATVPNARDALQLARFGGFDTENKPVTGLKQMQEQLAQSQARQELEAAELTRSQQTRIRTLGRGRTLTGDESVEMARARGDVTMEPTVEKKAFEDFAARYAGTGGGGGGGRERPPTATGGEGGFDRISGPIHVIVDNTPLQVTWSGAQPAAAAGKRRRGRVDEEAEAAAPPAKPPARPKDQPPFDLSRARDLTVTTTARQRAIEQEQRRMQTFIRLPTTRISPEQRAAERAAREAQKTAAVEAEAPFVAASGRAQMQEANERRLQIEERRKRAELQRQARLAQRADPLAFAEQRDVADTQLAEIRGQNRAIQRRVPRRGFGASLTDLITSIVGRTPLERQLEAADRAQREVTEINQTAEARSRTTTARRAVAQQIRGERLPSGDLTERGKELVTVWRGLITEGKSQNAIIRESTKVFNANADVVRKNTAAAFGAAAIGSIGSIGIGALTFGLGSAIAAPIITAVSEGLVAAISPFAERLSGFSEGTARIQGQVAESIRASSDDRKAVLAQLGVTARLTDRQLEAVQGPIGERGAAVAGGAALGERFELFNVANAIERQQFGGRDRSLFRSTGGAFDAQLPFKLFGVQDISIGGTPSVAERFNSALNSLPDKMAEGIANAQTLLAAPSAQAAEDAAGPGPVPSSIGQTLDRSDAGLQKVNKQLELWNKNLEFFNEDIAKEGFKFRPTSDAEALQRQQEFFEAAGQGDIGGKLEAKQFEVTGLNLNQAPIKEVGRFLDSLAKSEISVNQLLQQTARERENRIQLQEAQRGFQIGQIPVQQALQFAQRPFSDASAGIQFGAGDRASTQKRINAELKITQGLYNDINKEVKTGMDAAIDFVTNGTEMFGQKIPGLGAAAGKEFAASLNEVYRLGKQISSIEIGLQTKQAAYQAAQFSYQIGIAKRSLADAKGLAGQLTEASKDNLGVLEREQFLLQRRAQSMQMALAQRQINFQRAIAGFTAPGLTGEERAARIEQAKIEADFAQKQLNIQKELFGLQGRSFQITASRQVTDLVGQLGLLERGRVITLETAAAEKKIRALTFLQEKENAKVQAFYQAAVQRTNDIAGEIAQLATAANKAMVSVANDVIREYTRVINTITAQLNGASKYDSRDGRRATSSGRATGGNIMEGQSYWVGESGRELITPEQNSIVTPGSSVNLTPMGGSVNTTNITIMVTGNNVTSEDELKKLEVRITDAVTRAQSRQISLLGGRSY